MPPPNGRIAATRNFLQSEVEVTRCHVVYYQRVLISNERRITGLKLIRLTPPVRGGHKDPFRERDGMDVVKIETESTTAVAVEAGTVIATETETESNAVTITSEGADAKRERQESRRGDRDRYR